MDEQTIKVDEQTKIDIQKYEERNKNRIIKIVILIILLIIVVITSFRTGQKFYELKNTNFDAVDTEADSSIAKWRFKVKIIY